MIVIGTWLVLGMIIATIMVLLLIGELSYSRIGVDSTYIKFIIVSVSGTIFTLVPYVFHELLPIFIFTVIFSIITIVSRKFEALSFITREGRNKNYGAQLYPWSMFLLFYCQLKLEEPILFTIPMLYMSLCDCVASMIGMKWPWKPYTIKGFTKTISGSLAFFISAAICTSIIFYIHAPELAWGLSPYIFIVVMVGTLMEAIFQNGYDNLAVPLTTMVVIYFLLPYLSL